MGANVLVMPTPDCFADGDSLKLSSSRHHRPSEQPETTTLDVPPQAKRPRVEGSTFEV